MSVYKRIDGKIFAYYLMHDYGFSARFNGADPSVLEERIEDFADQLCETFRDKNIDEVLIVGHSSGVHIAVKTIAYAFRTLAADKIHPKVSFLSLGHVVPMVSFLPEAHQLRADLNLLSSSTHLTWVDVTAPSDGCTFALCDPVGVSGVAPKPQDRVNPLVISAAFSKTLSKQKLKEIRNRFFRIHIQYLCAFDFPNHYDYFLITAGPKTLQDRFRAVNSSPSMIDETHSSYTNMVKPE